MGWFFLNDYTKLELVDRLNRELPGDIKLLDSKVVGSNHWQLVEGSDGSVFVLLNMLQASGSGYGYKELTEMDHPYAYNCPAGFLKRCTAPRNDQSAMWRIKVAQFHQAKRKTVVLSPGQIIEFGGKFYQVYQKDPKPRMGYQVYEVGIPSSMPMRLPAKYVPRCKLLTKEEYLERVAEEDRLAKARAQRGAKEAMSNYWPGGRS